MDDRSGTFRSIALNLLRIVAGLLFMQHGADKLFAVFGGMGDGATAPAFTLMWVAGVLEFFGGALVGLGLDRPVAFVLSGEMAFAYFLSHFPQGFWPIENRGELAALFSFTFLFLAANGGGRFSLDGLFRGSRARLGDEQAGVDVRAGALAMAIAASAAAPSAAPSVKRTSREIAR